MYNILFKINLTFILNRCLLAKLWQTQISSIVLMNSKTLWCLATLTNIVNWKYQVLQMEMKSCFGNLSRYVEKVLVYTIKELCLNFRHGYWLLIPWIWFFFSVQFLKWVKNAVFGFTWIQSTRPCQKGIILNYYFKETF